MNESITLKTRVLCLKRKDNYTITSKGLICGWRVLNCRRIPFLCVNGKVLRVSRKDPYNVSIPELREFMRGLDNVDTPLQNTLDIVENVFFTQQLSAVEYYQSLTDKDFFNSVFTRDLQLSLYFGDGDLPDEINVEETYWDRKSTSEITETQEDMEAQSVIREIDSGVDVVKVDLSA